MRALPSSFRDPDGFLFSHKGSVYRQVNNCFSKAFDRFLDGGLYEALTSRGYLVTHQDATGTGLPQTDDCYRTLLPEQLPYISYPYEWCFSQLRDAAMLTLRVQTVALQHGFSLKDASAYNVQFHNGKPIFIDSLSFEPYRDGTPWAGYRQFCQHFLAPLALMAHVDAELGKLLVSHIDGIPLGLASTLLPRRTRFNYGLQAHLHLHARMQSSFADAAGEERAQGLQKPSKLNAESVQAIVESLASAVRKLEWKPPHTEWGDYYAHNNYSDDAAQAKRSLVDSMLASIGQRLGVIHDLGANTGEFSRIVAKHADLVVSQDIDPVAVERNYRQLREQDPRNLLPLRQDLFSPAPAIGWANCERDSFVQRARCDAILALALIHHLAISNNTPLQRVAELFASLGNWLVIEFVPKTDSQVRRLLQTREDVFPSYSEEGFEAAFGEYFSIENKARVPGSERSLYLMRSSERTAENKSAAD